MSYLYQYFCLDVLLLRILMAEDTESTEYGRALAAFESMVADSLRRHEKQYCDEIQELAVQILKSKAARGKLKFVTVKTLNQRLLDAYRMHERRPHAEKVDADNTDFGQPNSPARRSGPRPIDRETFPDEWIPELCAWQAVSDLLLMSEPLEIYREIYKQVDPSTGFQTRLAAKIGSTSSKLSLAGTKHNSMCAAALSVIVQLAKGDKKTSTSDAMENGLFRKLIEEIREALPGWGNDRSEDRPVDRLESLRLAAKLLRATPISEDGVKHASSQELLYDQLHTLQSWLTDEDVELNSFVSALEQSVRLPAMQNCTANQVDVRVCMPDILKWLEKIDNRPGKAVRPQAALSQLLQASPDKAEEGQRENKRATNRQTFVSELQANLPENELFHFVYSQLLECAEIGPVTRAGRMPDLFARMVDPNGLSPGDVFPDFPNHPPFSKDILEDWLTTREIVRDGQMTEPGIILFGADPASHELEDAKALIAEWLNGPPSQWATHSEVERWILVSQVMRAFWLMISTYRPHLSLPV